MHLHKGKSRDFNMYNNNMMTLHIVNVKYLNFVADVSKIIVSQLMIRIINLSNITTLSRHGWQINVKNSLSKTKYKIFIFKLLFANILFYT